MAIKKQLKASIKANFVAKHMKSFCSSRVYVDRKKQSKSGYVKHREGHYQNDNSPSFIYGDLFH